MCRPLCAMPQWLGTFCTPSERPHQGFLLCGADMAVGTSLSALLCELPFLQSLALVSDSLVLHLPSSTTTMVAGSVLINLSDTMDIAFPVSKGRPL